MSQTLGDKKTELCHCSQDSGGGNKRNLQYRQVHAIVDNMHKVLPVATCWNLEGILTGRVETESTLEGIKAKLKSLKLAW